MRESLNFVKLIGVASKDAEQRSMAAPVRILLVTGGEVMEGKASKKQHHVLVDWNRQRSLGIRQGDQIACEGSIEYRSWEKDGQKHWVTEIRVEKLEHENEISASHQSDEAVSQGRAKTIQRKDADFNPPF